MPDAPLNFYAPTPFGLGHALAVELGELGIEGVRPGTAGASWSGPLEQAYRVLLWSRLASRVLLQLGRFPAPDGDALYAGAREVDWTAHVDPDLTIAVRTSVSQAAIRHSGFAAKRLKDAVVDQLREEHDSRPSVDLRQPDLTLHLRLQGQLATVSLDLAGDSLHRRGYRVPGVMAPLKENLAAALLRLLDWPAIAGGGGAFVDPMCGSGTLPIEAAWMAGDRAPALDRQRWGFTGWPGHRPELWAPLVAEARQRAEAGLATLPLIVGFDGERAAVTEAIETARRAGLDGKIHLERRELGRCAPEGRAGERPGLVAVNPPYGKRLGTASQLGPLYAGLAAQLGHAFSGWRAGVLTTPELVPRLGVRPGRRTPLRNGALECELVVWRVGATRSTRPADAPVAAGKVPVLARGDAPPGAADFSARLSKRARHIGRWARRQKITCYRVYDADLADYNVAIDRYGDRVLVQEYPPPPSVDPELAARRVAVVMAAIPDVLEVSPARVHLKVRRHAGGEQLERPGEGEYFEVSEGPCAFLVNLTGFLDAGLYLDLRPVRTLVRELARDLRLLNLFGHTGTATVCAARGGAARSTTVERSDAFLGWARRNFTLNGLDARRHELVQADVLSWLRGQRQRWDLIHLDPPAYSRDRDATVTFDLQRDHLELLEDCTARLAKGGQLLLSTHSRRFRIDLGALERRGLLVQDRTRQTIPEDFKRTPRIHQFFVIERD